MLIAATAAAPGSHFGCLYIFVLLNLSEHFIGVLLYCYLERSFWVGYIIAQCVQRRFGGSERPFKLGKGFLRLGEKCHEEIFFFWKDGRKDA